MASNSGTITAATAAIRARGKVNVTPEFVLVKALKVLNSALSRRTPIHLRVQAARAVLATLHDAGIKPTASDLAVVFRKAESLDKPGAQLDDAPAPPADEEKSK